MRLSANERTKLRSEGSGNYTEKEDTVRKQAWSLRIYLHRTRSELGFDHDS